MALQWPGKAGGEKQDVVSRCHSSTWGLALPVLSSLRFLWAKTHRSWLAGTRGGHRSTNLAVAPWRRQQFLCGEILCSLGQSWGLVPGLWCQSWAMNLLREHLARESFAPRGFHRKLLVVSAHPEAGLGAAQWKPSSRKAPD